MNFYVIGIICHFCDTSINNIETTVRADNSYFNPTRSSRCLMVIFRNTLNSQVLFIVPIYKFNLLFAIERRSIYSEDLATETTVM